MGAINVLLSFGDDGCHWLFEKAIGATKCVETNQKIF